MTNSFIVLPRPGTVTPAGTLRVIPAPSEEAFVANFGNLLPRASYLHTQNGKAAYYELAPSSALPTDHNTPIARVLFLHGVQTPAIGLQPLASALSSRFPYAHCVLVDLWGHGLTDAPFVAYDTALFRALLEALMTQLGWDDAHYVGYSFGGSVTASFVAARPESIASMVLVAPAGLMRESNFTELQRSYFRGGEGFELQSQAGIIEFLEDGQLVVPGDWKERVGRGEIVAEAIRDWQLREHPGHAASVVAVFRDAGALDNHADFVKAANTSIKTLCILGELDDVCSVQDLADVGMRNVVVVPKVGHGVARECAPEVARLIGDFWNKL